MELIRKHRLTRFIFAAVIFFAFIYMLYPFMAPILMAALFSFALEPKFRKISARAIHKKLPASLLLVGIFVFLASPIILVLISLVQKIKELSVTGYQNIPLFKSLERIYELVYRKVSLLADKANVDISNLGVDPTELAGRVANFLVEFTTKMISSTPEILLGFIMFSCAFYFFMTEAPLIKKTVLKMNVLHPTEMNRVISVVQKSAYSTLITTAMIGALQAGLVTIAAIIFGYHEPLITFVITFFVSFIPIVGAGPVAAVLSLASFISGDYASGIGLLIAAAIVGSIDNIVRPYLVSQSEEVSLHPAIAFITIVGGIIVYGIPGLLLGPILIHLVVLVFPMIFENLDSTK